MRFLGTLRSFVAWGALLLTLPSFSNDLQKAFNSMEERRQREMRRQGAKQLALQKEQQLQNLMGLCIACHNFNEGEPSRGVSDEVEYVGPNLFGVFQRPIGSVEDFQYSPGFLRLDRSQMWTDETMSQFLKAPAKFAPHTTMKFAGMPDPYDRKLIIEYLRSLKSN